MKVCMVAEGCYPYVVGGVSGWINSMIKSFPDEEFMVVAIIADRSVSGKFTYELPPNLTQVYEVYLSDVDWGTYNRKMRSRRIKKKYHYALRSLLLNERVEWDTIFDMFDDPSISINELLMGYSFFDITREVYNLKYSSITFSDFLWTMRSIYLPLFQVIKSHVPDADVYHCVATGYSGVLGAKAKHKYHCSLLISEHGIYTREREEELIRAEWVEGKYKNMWIEQFRKMSTLAYDVADRVTSLYEHARELQIELGCPEEKTIVTPNGIDETRLANLPYRDEELDKVYVGAVLRVTPIKDVKTMIEAFGFATKSLPNLKLYIMGPADEDPAYAQECYDLVESMNLDNVVFTGRIDVKEYLGKMDMTILTSISEGQPLTILEGYAAHKPAIATDVGNCRGLIYGETDDFGDAGILTHIMNAEEIAQAIVELGRNRLKREAYGENGYKRLMKKYRLADMHKTYEMLYSQLGGLSHEGAPVSEEVEKQYDEVGETADEKEYETFGEPAAATEEKTEEEITDEVTEKNEEA